jgi:PadR family transcriptional regulator, regulatory protein AphA
MSLKYAILGLLDDQPRYGYEIKQQFEQAMGDLWPVSYGQLYPTLKRLKEEKLLTVRTEQGKKAIDKHVYSLTSNGKDAFNAWLKDSSKKLQTSIKDEFSLSLFFFDKMNKKEFCEELNSLKRRSQEKLALIRGDITLQNGQNGQGHPSKKLLLRKMELFLEAECRWIEEVHTEVSRD